MQINHNLETFDPAQPATSGMDTLIIGCGNLLRGDDATGPVLIRRMWERGLPDHVHCADGGTGGMDVAFQMRGVRHVILVDACQSDSPPGSLFELPGESVEQLPPIEGINLHAFRWDHAIAFGHWLLKEDYPDKVSVFLIEGADFEIGERLSPAVDQAIDRLVERLFTLVEQTAPTSLQLELSQDGYLRLSASMAQRHFPNDTVLALWRDGMLVLLPTRGAAAGGLMLKQSNVAGDRSLLISEVFDFDIPAGHYMGDWDEAIGGWRVAVSRTERSADAPCALAQNRLAADAQAPQQSDDMS